MAEISSGFLYAAFIIYIIAIFFFGGAIRQKKGLDASRNEGKKNWSETIAIGLTVLGFMSQVVYFITRWIASGHAPVSNMFEFVTFFSIMLVGGFIILYLMYRTNVLGLFTLPVAVIIIAYGSMFPTEITPLIPALQSDLLAIHVMTTAAGQGILAISFIAGLIYLIKNTNQQMKTKKTFWLEAVMLAIVVTVGFIVISTAFSLSDYENKIQWTDKDGEEVLETYHLPPIAGPNEGIVLTAGRMDPLVELPPFIEAKKLNTLIWSLMAGIILYLLIRLITKKRVAVLVQPFVGRISDDILDEIGYRSVLIGFPVFTLGALLFGMIWAHYAWHRFWAWDPKEVWALITWLFYAAFLHLRLSKGWHGERSAWLAVIGFGIIMFNLIFVNLVIAGLHSYA